MAADEELVFRDKAAGEGLLTESESLAHRNLEIEMELQRLRQELEKRCFVTCWKPLVIRQRDGIVELIPQIRLPPRRKCFSFNCKTV